MSIFDWLLILSFAAVLAIAFDQLRMWLFRRHERERGRKPWTHSVHDPIPPKPRRFRIQTRESNSSDHSVVRKVRTSRRKQPRP